MSKRSSDGELKIIEVIIKTYLDNLTDALDVNFDYNNIVVYWTAATIK